LAHKRYLFIQNIKENKESTTLLGPQKIFNKNFTGSTILLPPLFRPNAPVCEKEVRCVVDSVSHIFFKQKIPTDQRHI